MARIVELLTVNVAARDVDETLAKYRNLGLSALPAFPMPEPPAEIVDVSLPIGEQGAISIIAPTGPGSPVQRFLDKRGEGIYSIAVRVDDLLAAMREWKGVQWVLSSPHEFSAGNPAARYLPEKLLVNWIKPSSLNGVMLECFEFRGKVAKHGEQQH
jgi:4-hydroxyphenylpyruvate dioxygenase-like putative hemolysin